MTARKTLKSLFFALQLIFLSGCATAPEPTSVQEVLGSQQWKDFLKFVRSDVPGNFEQSELERACRVGANSGAPASGGVSLQERCLNAATKSIDPGGWYRSMRSIYADVKVDQGQYKAEVRTVGDRAVYLRLPAFHSDTYATVTDAFNQMATRGEEVALVIIDVRNCPGGLLDVMEGVMSVFLSEGTEFGLLRSTSDKKLLAKLGNNRGAQMPSKFAAMLRTVPMVILADGRTSGGAEAFVSGMRGTGRAKVFGTKTQGGALVRTVRPSHPDFVLSIRTGTMLNLNGMSWEDVGLTPDVTLKSFDRVQPVAIPPDEDEWVKFVLTQIKSSGR